MGGELHQLDVEPLLLDDRAVDLDVVTARAAQPGHIPGIDDLELGLVDEEHLRLGHAGGRVDGGLVVLVDWAGHEGPLNLVAAALEGGLAPDLVAAVRLLNSLAGHSARAAAAAHDHTRVVDVDLLRERLVHAADSHGVDLGADHDVPADGSIDRRDRFEHFNRLDRTRVLAADFGRECEAEEALRDERVDRFLGEVAQLLRLVTALADDLGELADTLEGRALQGGRSRGHGVDLPGF